MTYEKMFEKNIRYQEIHMIPIFIWFCMKGWRMITFKFLSGNLFFFFKSSVLISEYQNSRIKLKYNK